MSSNFSLQGCGAVAVSEELRELLRKAYEMHGKTVEIPAKAVGNSCSDLSSRTTDEILEIRRQERTISSQTLGLRFA